MRNRVVKFVVLLLPVLFCICFTLSESTVAYLSAEDSADNLFKAGIVKGEIDEVFPSGEVKSENSLKKEVRVVNTGNLPVFVRAKVMFSDSLAEENSVISGGDMSFWEYNETDGYYYGKSVVLPSESTPLLMSTIYFGSDLEEIQGAMDGFELYVYAEQVLHGQHEGECNSGEYKDIWVQY